MSLESSYEAVKGLNFVILIFEILFSSDNCVKLIKKRIEIKRIENVCNNLKF